MENKLKDFLVLIILDGWGIAPKSSGNAISLAKTPNMDSYLREYPNTKLMASGEAVGLPRGVMGTSEVGHLNIGAGRVVLQEATIINEDIKNKNLRSKPSFIDLMEHVASNKSNIHLMGLLSDCYVHSTITHLFELLRIFRSLKIEKSRVKIHVFTDGRDSPPTSSLKYLSELEEVMSKNGVGEIATISGRYYSMDRDGRWERTKLAYECMVEAKGERSDNPQKVIVESHKKGITDEFITPKVITHNGNPVGNIKNGDGVIFYNFREDRMRQLSKAFLQNEFNGFHRRKVDNLYFLSMVEFEETIAGLTWLYGKVRVFGTLAEVISKAGYRQFHIAESEKYAHVTYFFNGGREITFPGEDRVIIPSPKDVETYDKKPEMSAREISSEIIKRIKSNKYKFLLINFANPDMVAHTGNMKASIKACEITDKYVGEIVDKTMAGGGDVVITADHGNAEELLNTATGGMDTQHSTNLVPFILVSESYKNAKLKDHGALANIAPTILKLLRMDKSKDMSAASVL